MVRVYIDQDLCTGSMVCESITPQVFAMDDEGLATVIHNGAALPDGGAGKIPGHIKRCAGRYG